MQDGEEVGERREREVGREGGGITKKLKRVFGVWMQSSAIEMIPGAWQVEGNRCAGVGSLGGVQVWKNVPAP